jgi:hypothetical protein
MPPSQFAMLMLDLTQRHWRMRKPCAISMHSKANSVSRFRPRCPVCSDSVGRFKKQVGDEITIMYRWFEDVGYDVDISAGRQEYHGLSSFDQWMNFYRPSSARTPH